MSLKHKNTQHKAIYLKASSCVLLLTRGPTLRAVDAAGAARDLGATFGRGGVPSLVPVGGGRQRRR